ncbi:MAG: hypothetical protein V1886_03140 [archaeon]
MAENKINKMNRKAQLKIQETAFMLLALAFLFALLFIFYSNFQVNQIYSAKNKLLSEQAISLLDKFMSLPEFSCLQGACIDEDKLYALRNMSAYEDLWKGIAKIQVVRIYPKQEMITIYQKGKAEMSYSSFVPLCKTMQYEGYVWQQCSLAKLLISIEKAGLKRT